jgi:hypothetical protein
LTRLLIGRGLWVTIGSLTEQAYARRSDQRHWPAWTAFNRRVGTSRGDVGIWHETYRIRAGDDESIYSGMPPFGLGKVGRLVLVGGDRESARGRLAGSA